jgi:hypothetical protein
MRSFIIKKAIVQSEWDDLLCAFNYTAGKSGSEKLIFKVAAFKKVVWRNIG